MKQTVEEDEDKQEKGQESQNVKEEKVEEEEGEEKEKEEKSEGFPADGLLGCWVQVLVQQEYVINIMAQ